jgi:hypothetical protein
MGRRMRRESHVSRGRGWNHHNKHLLEFDKRINKGTRVKFCLRIPQEGLLADAPCRYYYTFRDGYMVKCKFKENTYRESSSLTLNDSMSC